MKYLASMTLSVILVASVVVAGVDPGQETRVLRWTIDGGGATHSQGGDWELSGTIGQPDAVVMQGPPFTLTGGFWLRSPSGDCDDTGCVGLVDCAEFELCMTGPDGLPAFDDCRCFDVDQSGVVDLADFWMVQATFVGE